MHSTPADVQGGRSPPNNMLLLASRKDDTDPLTCSLSLIHLSFLEAQHSLNFPEEGEKKYRDDKGCLDLNLNVPKEEQPVPAESGTIKHISGKQR